MTGRVRPGGAVVGLFLVLTPVLASAVAGQSTKIPSTLRYGSGLIDVPVAGVLPHRALTMTYSGFWIGEGTDYTTDASGRIIGRAPIGEGWSSDFALALGFYDLLEVGTSVQSLKGADEGGTLWGAFGRLSLLNPSVHGLGLAIGGRYSNGPDFGDGVDYAPNRLGRADRRVRNRLGSSAINTEFSFYAVAGLDVPGVPTRFLPPHDFTFSGGWGTGLFRDGAGLDWYEAGESGGWFAGAAWHLRVARGKMVTLMTEYNGFDWNVGTQVDLGGVRLGVHALGRNYDRDMSVYRSSKIGLLASVAICGRGLCRASLRERPPSPVVVLPAPPPDTVVVVRPEESSPARGTLSTLCLATGAAVEIFRTEGGDTLVGPSRVSIDDLRPALSFAGTYAGGTAWLEAGESISFDARSFDPEGATLELRCEAIRRVGEYLTVPLFVMRDEEEPWELVYVPVRPGEWQAYRAGF